MYLPTGPDLTAEQGQELDDIVTGPGVNICDECLMLSAKVIAKEPVPQFRSLDDMNDEELIADVLRVLASREQVEGAVMDRVRRLRTRGVTWHRIGEALGMSRQSAWDGSPPALIEAQGCLRLHNYTRGIRM